MSSKLQHEDVKHQVASELKRMESAVQRYIGPKLQINADQVRYVAQREFLAGLRHLAWLLGLSDGERAFVDAAATAKHTNDNAGLYEMLMVFADWLEDVGRTDEAVRLRKIVPETGDLVAVEYPANLPQRNSPSEAQKVAAELCHQAYNKLRELGREVVFAVQPAGWDIKHMDREAMRNYGWVRQEEVAQAVAAEREACAKTCEWFENTHTGSMKRPSEAIRARGADQKT